jgi:hypothetical protein
MTNERITAILANPHALVNHQLRATDAHNAANRCDWLRGWFDEIWETAKQDTSNARPARDNMGRSDPADVLNYEFVALRGALEADEIYSALASLPPEQRYLLFNSVQGPHRAELVNATLAAIPAGAAWLERKARRDAVVNASNAEAAARRDAEWEAGQPARVLEAVEAAGSTLSLGKPKGIMATGDDLRPEHVELIRQYRPGIESILAARAAAAAPRPVV